MFMNFNEFEVVKAHSVGHLLEAPQKVFDFVACITAPHKSALGGPGAKFM